MQTQAKLRVICTLQEAEHIQVKVETSPCHQSEVAEIKPPNIPDRRSTTLHNLILPERGVPFSPLND
jgi:hypothetical protein